MNSLYLIDTLAVGGAEQSLLSILQRLQYIRPVMCHLYPGEALKPAYEAAGIPVVSLDTPGKYGFRAAARAVGEVVEREKPDVVHTTLFRADVVGRRVCSRVGLPLINSFVSDSYGEARLSQMASRQRYKHRVVQWVDRVTARRVDHFTANSEATKRENVWALRVAPDRVTVIYRGRDPERFSPRPTADASLDSGRPVLLTVGRLLTTKGHEELVTAFVRVRARHPHAQLLIAGDGPNRPRLDRSLRDHDIAGSVRLLGTRDDVPQLLRAADLFVFPSHYEGLPGALVEAMFTALPIVASDIPVHRESVTDGVSARLVPVQDPGALAEGILWMLDHPAEAAEMGRRARETALQKFDIDQVARQHEALYERVIREHRDQRGRR